jgi:hypothetical protein
VQDAHVISATVARLPVTSVLPFMQAVLQRIHGKPARVATLASWLRALLSTHAAYLMSCSQVRAGGEEGLEAGPIHRRTAAVPPIQIPHVVATSTLDPVRDRVGTQLAVVVCLGVARGASGAGA